MDIRQLRYFLAVAEEGQITGAAKKLNMEQPPLSRQMKLLEQELNVTLFDRSGKRLTLTHAGELLHQRAGQLIQQLHETVNEVQELEAGVKGVLSIGSVVSCVSLLPPRIERFREIYHGVTFKIREGDHILLGEQLEHRNIELVVARLPFEAAFEPESYDILRLPPDPFVAILPRSWHPQPTESGISLRELAQYPFITLKSDQTTAMHTAVLQEFRQAGLSPHIICECSSVSIIIALVAASIGATILPQSVMASFPIPDIAAVSLSNSDIRSDVGLVWLKNRHLSRRAQRFIELFAEAH